MRLRELFKSSLWLLWIAFLWAPVHAQDSTTIFLTLDQAKQKALELNKTIKASKMDIEIAKKKVMETTAIGLPQAKLDANYQHVFKVPEFGFPTSGFTEVPLSYNGPGMQQFPNNDFGGINQYVAEGAKMPIMETDNATFNFQVTQLIFSGEYIVGLQATKVFKTITEQMLVKNELDLLLDVESTYHLALILIEEQKIVDQNVELIEKNVIEMRSMLTAGFIDETDLDQQELALTGLKNLQASIKGQTTNIHNLLKYQIGLELTQSIKLIDNIEQRVETLPQIITDEFIIKDNIEYQMATNQIEIRKLNLRRQQSTLLPTIAAFYQHQEKLKTPLLDFTPEDLLGVSLSLPIFTSTQRLSQIKQAAIELDKSKLQQLQLSDGLMLQYETQKLNYQTAHSNYLNQRGNKEVSKRIFEKTTTKFKEGVSSSLELTQIQAQYLTANQNYFNSIINLLNAKATINRLMSK